MKPLSCKMFMVAVALRCSSLFSGWVSMEVTEFLRECRSTIAVGQPAARTCALHDPLGLFGALPETLLLASGIVARRVEFRLGDAVGGNYQFAHP